MRILIPVGHYYPDYRSGSARLAFDEALFLANAGHEVWMIAPDMVGGSAEYAFEHGLHVLRYPRPEYAAFDPRRMRGHQDQCIRILAQHCTDGFDVVHGHSLVQYEAAFRLWPKGFRACFSVHSPAGAELKANSHGGSFLYRANRQLAAYLANKLERRLLHASHCITAFSCFTKSLIRETHGQQIDRKVQVYPGWVDTQRFQILSNRKDEKRQLGWPLDVPVLFTLRRLVPRMGLERLLEALHVVKSQGLPFHMVIGGAGPLRNRLEALINALGLQGDVTMVGFVPDDRLPAMYGAADAFVLPTLDLECFGLIAIESLACGRPVLATPVGAIPEVLQDLESQWLSNDQSTGAIADLLMRFLAGKLPVHSSESLRNIVISRYSQDQILAAMTAAILPPGDVLKSNGSLSHRG